MNNNNILLSCLYDDLGALAGITSEPRVLSHLKDALLDSIESAGMNEIDRSLVRRISSTFGLLPPVDCFVSDPLFIEWFKKVYQLICFTLKVKQKTFTNEQETAYLKKIDQIEAENRALRIDPNGDLIRMARYLLRRCNEELDLSYHKIAKFAHHGPGAVFDRTTHDDKSWWSAEFRTLNRALPPDWYFASLSVLMDEFPSRERFDHITARLALVPKDWKGPRGVFISPKEAVFAQLGIDEAIKECAKRSFMSNSYTPESQLPSQELALFGSSNREWSTLDLSDASDRVTVQLVRHLYNRNDYIMLASTRPSHIVFPNGERRRLSMLSPMGDGKTFTVLTQVCWCLGMGAILLKDGYLPARGPSLSVLRDYSRKIKVYGDDIIVETAYYHTVCEALEACGLRVNLRKSFTNGFFRESCGCDALYGRIVTPIRQKISLDATLSAEDAAGLIEFHNRIVSLHPTWLRTIAFLRSFITSNVSKDIAYTHSFEEFPHSLYEPRVDVCRSLNLRRPRCEARVSDLHYIEVNGISLYDDESYMSSYCDRYRYNVAMFPYYTKTWGDIASQRKKNYSPIFTEWYNSIVLRRNRYRKGGIRFRRSWVKF